MSRRRVLAGRRWLQPGKRTETVIGYLCRRGHYVFTAEGPEEDACQSKNAGEIIVRQTQRHGWTDAEFAEFVAEAEESLGRHLSRWRECNCEGLREERDAVTATLDFVSDGADDGPPPSPEEFRRVRRDVATARRGISELIERSSLGTLEARALRGTVSDEAAANVVARAKELADSPGSETCPHCYEDVQNEDDHLVGDKDVNAWFECPEG